MANFEELWKQYGDFLLRELDRQNHELGRIEEQQRALVALIHDKERELMKTIAKIETEMAVQKTKMAMIAFGLSAIVSVVGGVLKEFLIK